MSIRGYLFGDVVTMINGALAATGSAGVPSGDQVSTPSQPIGGRAESAVFQTIVAGGTVSALTVDFLYSLDGTNWKIALSATDLTGGVYPQTGIVAPFWAADISVFTGASGTPAVTVLWTQ